MAAPLVGLSLMLEDDFRVAAAPLFGEGLVDLLEWSFDTGWHREMPTWAEALADHYGSEGRLFGHGVHYSAFSATWEPRQAAWLADLARELERRPYVRVSEHYGFMTAPPFVRGAPLPVPRCEASLRIGRDRLARMRDVVATQASPSIGIENLALAWNRTEALAHGPFLGELLAGTDDFIVLDVHNVYCQVENFDLAPDEILSTFPVERVREIHVSGGSHLPAWASDPGTVVRCDTHDDRVPEAVFDLLGRALARFPRVDAVVFERLGGTIRSAEDSETFRRDFLRVREIAGAGHEI